MRVTAIIPSAGTGERMQRGIKKPYIGILGRPMLTYTLSALCGHADITQVIVPVHPGEEDFCERQVLQKLALSIPVEVIAGGKARQDSVRNALALLPDGCDLVLIHDGARPLITPEMVARAIEATGARRATTMAVPVKDTITLASAQSRTIEQTLPRERLYAIQTPQTFERGLIVRAHDEAFRDGVRGTDDASLVQRLGVPVAIIPGSYTNIKITTPEDLIFAETVLRREQSRKPGKPELPF